MSAVIGFPENQAAFAAHEEEHFEIVNGERVELPPMGAYHSTLASFLCGILEPFTRLNHLGRIGVETLFQLTSDGNLQRKPDLAYISYERWPMNRRVPNTSAWEVVPNLAVEINSPTNTADGNLLKLQDYFRVGIDRVWFVFPSVEQVHVYRSPGAVAILNREDKLTEESLLPGFSVSLEELFRNGVADFPQANGASPRS